VAVECLDDNAVNAYVARTLPDGERRRVVEHLSSCETCLTITCAAAGDDREVGPERVGRYTLIEMIGRGAMGSVYVARDPQLDRKVALKVVRAENFAEPEVRLRLSREARAMAQVRHPNVVTVHDAGELDGGVFLAMELIEGETLTRWLAARRPWRAVLAVLLAAGRGLAAAHAAGLVHRDFKPDNVLIDGAGRVAVTDFGLAHGTIAGARDDDPDLALTRTGALLGTPRYMSPEQFRGDDVDARSDQFGFAVALYEALYRAPPFAGATLGELSRAVIAGQLRPRPAGPVPRRVHAVIARALGPRDARYPAMPALLAALERAARRPRLPAIAAGVGVAALAVALWPGAPAPTAGRIGTERTPLFVERFANRTGDARLDDTLDVAVGAALSASVRIDPVAGPELEAAAADVGSSPSTVDDLAAKLAAIDDRPTLVVHGSVERRGAGFRITLEGRGRGEARARFTGAREVPLDGLVGAASELAAGLLAALGEPVPAARVLTPSVAAIHAYVGGVRRAMASDEAGALVELRRAVALDPELAEARSALGLTLYGAGDHAAGVAELERAFRGADRIPERQRLGLLGDYYSTVGRTGDAVMAYEQLLAKWPGDARTQVNLTATAIDGRSWPLALEAARATRARHAGFEVVQRNLVLAELGNELVADAVRDGRALVKAFPQSVAGREALAAALALAGEPAAEVLGDDARARADLAAFEGRLDDALATPDPLLRARIQLRRGERPEVSARDAAPTEAYLAASLAVDAGRTDGLGELARRWGTAPEPDRRLYGQLLAGDLARAAGDGRGAVEAYEAAGRIGASWLVHERLARGHLAAGDHAAAERELAWCLAHRGEAAVLALPSLALVPEVYLLRARSLRDRHAPAAEVAAAYRALAALAPAAQHDPWTEEAIRAAPGAGR
jgi:tRNA A-37 threonylcarbamoyl transferase component Bud32/tetratricopeptide (TPR) repeat protein